MANKRKGRAIEREKRWGRIELEKEENSRNVKKLRNCKEDNKA